MRPDTDVNGDGSGLVTVRYWASARAAAGVAQEVLTGGTVAAVLDAARRAHPTLVAVLPVCTLLLDGRAALRGDPVPPGATLEVLPPFAGG